MYHPFKTLHVPPFAPHTTIHMLLSTFPDNHNITAEAANFVYDAQDKSFANWLGFTLITTDVLWHPDHEV